MNTETNNDTAENASAAPAPICPPPPKPRTRRPHRSKITDLPEPIREFLNVSIHNHVPYDKIIELLAEKGHPGIKKNNIVRWAKSGFQLWLQQRERFQCLCLKVDNVEEQFRQLDAKGTHHADRLHSRMIDIHMVQAMRDFEADKLKELLEKDPANFFKFVRANHAQSLIRQRDDRLEVIRHKAGIGRKTGPNELARQSVKDAFNLSDSWFNPPETTTRTA